MDSNETDAAKQYAFRLLGARPRTRREITGRLERKGISVRAVREAVNALERTGCLNDERFARDFIEAKLRTAPAGRKFFRAELLKRGVDEQTAETALEELLPPAKEYEAACSAAMRAFARYSGRGGEAGLKRVYAHLLRRGFSTEAAGDAVSKTGGCHPED